MKQYKVFGTYKIESDNRFLHRGADIKAENIAEAISKYNTDNRKKFGAIISEVETVHELVWSKL